MANGGDEDRSKGCTWPVEPLISLLVLIRILFLLHTPHLDHQPTLDDDLLTPALLSVRHDDDDDDKINVVLLLLFLSVLLPVLVLLNTTDVSVAKTWYKCLCRITRFNGTVLLRLFLLPVAETTETASTSLSMTFSLSAPVAAAAVLLVSAAESVVLVQ